MMTTLLWTMMLAMADPTPDELWAWLKGLCFVLGIYLLGLKIVKEHKRDPSIDVTLENVASKDAVTKIELQLPSMATKAELQAISDGLMDRLTDQEHHLDGKRSENTKELHDKIAQSEKNLTEQIRRTDLTVSKVQVEAETHTRQISNLDLKVDRILERLPRRNG